MLSSAYLTAAWNNGLQVSVTGYRNGVQLYSQILTYDTAGPTLTKFNWAGVDEVRFSSSGGTSAGFGGSGEHFAMDDLTVWFFDLAKLQESLSQMTAISGVALTTADMAISGAHGRPLARRLGADKNTFWVAGDLGSDEHGNRSGYTGLGELGIGRNFGPLQVNVALGQSWAKQELSLDGWTRGEGTYLLTDLLLPLDQIARQGESGGLWGILTAFGQWSNVKTIRGYSNFGTVDYSTGLTDTSTWGIRARLEWDQAIKPAGVALSPYTEVNYKEAHVAPYAETGGSLPANFGSRTSSNSDIRLGVNGVLPLSDGLRLVGVVEGAHQLQTDGSPVRGNMLGLNFDLPGHGFERDWMRAGFGLEGSVADGTFSVQLNATTKSDSPDVWMAVSYQTRF